MDFAITPSDPTPIYRQIVDQARRYIAGGHWPAGHELPSVRAVALAHAINPMTVSKAYSQLEAEGLLVRRRGMGMVVADQSPQRRRPRRTADAHLRSRCTPSAATGHYSCGGAGGV
ncbi:GntR family transcriptional regulator [Ideonella paludis]|uniref:GntR family transcriptional regulator n=1 Tax=Ideonella paludis TaxID=1233411 RepID=UPI003630065E